MYTLLERRVLKYRYHVNKGKALTYIAETLKTSADNKQDISAKRRPHGKESTDNTKIGKERGNSYQTK